MIRKLAPYTKGYRVYILLGILCSAGEAVLELMLRREGKPQSLGQGCLAREFWLRMISVPAE